MLYYVVHNRATEKIIMFELKIILIYRYYKNLLQLDQINCSFFQKSFFGSIFQFFEKRQTEACNRHTARRSGLEIDY